MRTISMDKNISPITHAVELPPLADSHDPHGEANVADRDSAFTIFSIPKPFQGPTAILQANAINSWKKLNPEIEIILIGDDEGVAEYANRLNVRHLAEISRNRQGTPLLSSAFAIASDQAKWPTLVYCNCDVILLADFARAVNCLSESSLPEFLAFGRRYDLFVDRELDFDDPHQIDLLKRELMNSGRAASIVCKEYFIFDRLQFSDLPDFAVGRGNWDNWMVQSSKRNGIPVIDITNQTRVIHQAHDYSHLSRIKTDSKSDSIESYLSSLAPVDHFSAREDGPSERKNSRWFCYVAGEEAKENERLAGGKHLIAGSTPTWVLADSRLRPVKFSWLNLRFFWDLPRFLRLSWELVKSR